MKIVLDTNVLVSGVFFGGPPYEILEAWREGRIRLVVSPDILAEYYRVGADLSDRYPQVDLQPLVRRFEWRPILSTHRLRVGTELIRRNISEAL